MLSFGRFGVARTAELAARAAAGNAEGVCRAHAVLGLQPFLAGGVLRRLEPDGERSVTK